MEVQSNVLRRQHIALDFNCRDRRKRQDGLRPRPQVRRAIPRAASRRCSDFNSNAVQVAGVNIVALGQVSIRVHRVSHVSLHSTIAPSLFCGRENEPTRGFSSTYCLIFHKNKIKMFLLTRVFVVVCLTMFYQFLDAFAKLRKAIISFVISLAVCPHGTTRLPLDGFSWNLIFENFVLKYVEKIQLSLKSGKNSGYFT